MVQLKSFAVIATTLFGCCLAAPTTSPGVDSTIPGSYIITLKSAIRPPAVKAHLNWVDGVHKRSLEKRDGDNGVEKTFETEAGFHGYSGTFDDETVKQIKKSPEVARVEPDRRVKLTWNASKRQEQPVEPAPPAETISQEGEDTGDEDDDDQLEKRSEINQKSSTWGLGTISHRDKGFQNYLYHKPSGSDSFAYLVDSGVRITHKEFQGRAKNGWTAFRKDYVDRLGHGTHVAGTIAGKTFGVAKKAKVISVKVFQGDSADLSVILNGIEWAVNDIIKKNRQEFSVINLSLGIDGVSGALNDIIKNAAKSGVIFVVAAGNQGTNAKTKSPASAPQAITVGAIDKNWRIPSWSNYGSSVDMLAPGVDVVSASWLSDSGTYIESGTSMATPHVSGLVLYAQSVYGITGVDTTTKYIKKYATNNKVLGSRRGSPNRIANNNNFAQSR
ncbi:peptidase S8/S53 domain-containing protein [Fusarium redolens]|uniref:Peptidase S8/S53 domain-containing protein n=1 Tax=Fusarium redolens TaxID=48865 RepID=A0A9P9HW85_FUSRE|nr:peptidase S8/S53 domain-containing protein [Fusarium redolens]KAH7265128.1 peptidase S8/S53 domain-containing protein [Fusarium redolens]